MGGLRTYSIKARSHNLRKRKKRKERKPPTLSVMWNLTCNTCIYTNECTCGCRIPGRKAQEKGSVVRGEEGLNVGKEHDSQERMCKF